MRKQLVPIATVVVAVALLAGCSSGPSKASQCTDFSKTVTNAAEGVQGSVANLQSDPDAAVTKLKELDAKIKDSVGKLSDADLQQKGEAFESAYADMVTEIASVSKDPASADVSKLTDATKKVQSTGNAFQKECTS